ncbi:MAG: DUF4387 domain-containing protein [Candidatus Fermentithermobacillus carboniphilus]|uniref:DUF4387 domain-containing protein n=1 Tax=Candidatus Fermentithermobacillus carboniphilus TaxID=3085328 RepID=A0AAT9LAK8_9FIRM|nr:MAG: DUF4387 domain-containing protein [Candidatus Fermentithermobacillus carboniphilus]
MKLAEMASVIRSKNASPFVTTLDIFFEDRNNFLRVKDSGVLNKETISRLYKVPQDSILGIWFVDLCCGIKISFLKPKAADDIESSDVYGAQQNAPLLDLEI